MLIDSHVERLDSCTTLSYVARRVRFQKGRIFYRSSESVYYTNDSDRCQSYMDLAMWQDLEKVHLPFLRFNRSRSNDRTKDSGKTKDFQLHAPVSPSQICSFVPVTLFVTIYGLSPNRLGMAASNEIKRLPEEISICYLSLLPRPVMSFCDGSLCFSIHT